MQIIELGSGKCSYFGGPNDLGVGNQEGLGCIEMSDMREWWFRRIFQNTATWDNSKGLARNLNPFSFYIAMRWAYTSFDGVQGEILHGYSREQIRRATFILEANDKAIFTQASDWGPNTNTGRLLDMAPGCCNALGVKTDDIVKVSAII